MAQKSPLISLPAELRNEIYDLALTHSDGPIDVTSDEKPNEPALLATCVQIRTEATPIFYANNSFRFGTIAKRVSEGKNLRLRHRLETLGERRCAFITTLQLQERNKALDIPLVFPWDKMQFRQFAQRCKDSFRLSMKRLVESNVKACQESGIRLHAIKFEAPNRLHSRADVVGMLVHEIGELVLGEYAEFDKLCDAFAQMQVSMAPA